MKVEPAIALDELLRAVRRRLRRQHAARLVRTAAWISVAIACVATLAHFLLLSIEPRWLIAVLCVPFALALVATLVRRPSREECAGWADRHLGGTSAFATYLEVSAAAGASSAARTRLWEYVDERVQHARATLQELAPDRVFVRPLVAASLCMAFAAALLQVPGRESSSSLGTRTSVASNALQDATDRAAVEDAQDSLPASPLPQTGPETPGDQQREPGQPDPQTTPRASQEKAGATPTAGQQATAEVVELEGPIDAGISQQPGGGREAGNSRDASDGMQSSAAWQGELVAKLRRLTDRSEASQLQADPEKAAEYSAPSATPTNAPAESGKVEPLAATAPSARDTMPMDPATRAYVRRYFETAGDEQ